MTAIAPSPHPDLGLDDLPQHCRFQHPFFSKLGEIVFHPGEGEGLPVLEMALGDKIATLPLPSLQIELEIEEAFADGRMLALIERALEFVNDLRLGEALETGFTAVCARGSRCLRTGIMREQAWTRSSGCWSAAPTSSQHPDICRCRSGNPWRKPPSSMRQNRGNWYGEPQPHRRARGFCSTWNRLPAVAPKNA